jgi:hypothetical protein
VPGWYRWEGRDLLLQLKLHPRSSRDEFAGPHDDRLRVRITAPPVDGKANSHLVAWLARQFGVGKSSVVIEAGQTSRLKRVRIRAPAQVPPIIAPAQCS